MWSSDIDEGHLESKFLHATDSTNEFEVEISIPESGVHALPDLAAELPDPESEKPRETRSPFIDLVQLYRTQIAKVPLLSAEREIDLAKRIEAGVLAQEQLETRRSMTEQLRRDLESLAVDGRSAKQEFISANLRLVVSMAPKFAHRGLAFLDLIQEGNQGLIRAVEGFDYTLGYKFSTYASWWIRQAMTRALADQARTIRIPVHMVEEINKVGGAERKLGVVLGRSPTAVEVAIELGISVAKVKALRDYRRDPLSLSFPLPCPDPGFSEFWVDPDERLVELGYLLHDEQDEDLAEGVTYSLLQEQLESVFDTLSDRESGVIQMRFGFSDGQAKTLAEIGHVYGVTRERIRQIEKESMAKLRHPSRSAVLRDYLDPSHSGVPHRATKGLKAHATVEEDST
jgi:RNA polymerase primary sigma factor